LAIEAAAPEKLAVMSLREEGYRELLFAWRVRGSGGYLGYILLDCGSEGVVELLRQDSLAGGSLNLEEGVFGHTRSIHGDDQPLTLPIAREETRWEWDGRQFISHTVPEHIQKPLLYGANSSMSGEIRDKLRVKALEMNVPPVLVEAVAMVETGGRHYKTDGSVITGAAGEIGIMQVMPNPYTFTPQEIEKLKELDYNIETGIRILIDKKMYSGLVTPIFVEPGDHGTINMDDNILETWYFTLWAYNGWVNANNPSCAGEGATYQDKVFNQMIALGSKVERLPAGQFGKDLPIAGELFPLPGKNYNGVALPGYDVLARVDTGTLNVREKPGTVFGPEKAGTKITGVLKEGQEVVPLEGPYTNTRARWYRVWLPDGDIIGWVAAVYKVNPNTLSFTDYLIPAGRSTSINWPAPKDTVTVYKPWTIKFNFELDESSVHGQTVFIMDKRGNKVPVSYKVNGDTILVAPAVAYLPGNEYCLYITGSVRSKDRIFLQSPVRMSFYCH
jgi:hypothetical protein